MHLTLPEGYPMNTALFLPTYPVAIGNDLADLASLLDSYRDQQVVVLCDTNSHAFCLDIIRPALPRNFREMIFPSGEENKKLDSCAKIWEQLLIFGVGRKDLLVNLGGGVVGDMGGFCAATFKRGIDFIQIPTTLLSMVDASVGGKLGIDFLDVKNAIGVFNDPKAVFVLPQFLKTLPPRQLISGFAEMIKHALISDVTLWEAICMLNPLETENWQAFIADSLRVKQQIVLKDPRELGLRKALNVGHTIGHGIEGVMLHQPDFLLHGEAIAAGILAESWLSCREGLLDTEEFQAIFRMLKIHFPLSPFRESLFDDFIRLMYNDKKNERSGINLSLVGPIGKVNLDCCFTPADIREALQGYNNLLRESGYN